MTTLIKNILDKSKLDIITDTELRHLVPGSNASRYNQVKRAIAHGDLISIRRGLYILSRRFQRQGFNLYELANRIYGPSYISFEAALSYHGMIPEAVYSVTSASAKQTCSFETPVGIFHYSRIPPNAFMVGVDRVAQGSHVFLMASPLKAITDYVYFKRLDWMGIEPLMQSLRIEQEELNFSSLEMEELQAAYNSRRIFTFLDGLKKDLA